MKPNLFVIGASKAGSTFLHDILKKHPDICMSIEKEPWFFNDDAYKERENEYSELFKRCDKKKSKYVGESSPIYSETTYFPDIPKRIKQYSPDAKLIYIVREPFSRLKSVYKQTMFSGHWVEKKFYNEIMPTDYISAIHQYPPFLEATKYFTHISNYLKVFDKSNLKVIFFEDLINDVESTLSQVYSFLNINDLQIDLQNVNQNQSLGKKQYNPTLISLYKSIPFPLKALISKNLKQKLREYLSIFDKKIPEPELTKEEEMHIRSILFSEVEGLYKYLNITDDPWHFFKDIEPL